VTKALEKQGRARAWRDSEARYRLITEPIRGAVFLVDLPGGTVGSEQEIGRPDGLPRWVERSAGLPSSTTVGEVGRVIGHLAMVRDLTEEKRAEDELGRQREALFRSEKLAAMGQRLAGVEGGAALARPVWGIRVLDPRRDG
jgi:PAS domain-containing protein